MTTMTSAESTPTVDMIAAEVKLDMDRQAEAVASAEHDATTEAMIATRSVVTLFETRQRAAEQAQIDQELAVSNPLLTPVNRDIFDAVYAQKPAGTSRSHAA